MPGRRSPKASAVLFPVAAGVAADVAPNETAYGMAGKKFQKAALNHFLNPIVPRELFDMDRLLRTWLEF